MEEKTEFTKHAIGVFHPGSDQYSSFEMVDAFMLLTSIDIPSDDNEDRTIDFHHCGFTIKEMIELGAMLVTQLSKDMGLPEDDVGIWRNKVEVAFKSLSGLAEEFEAKRTDLEEE